MYENPPESLDGYVRNIMFQILHLELKLFRQVKHELAKFGSQPIKEKLLRDVFDEIDWTG